MSENAENAESAANPVGAASEGAAPEPVPAGRGRRGGRIAAIAVSVVAAGAVVAGVGFTVVTVNGANRDAGAPVWTFPKGSKAGETKAAPGKGLGAMLVPYGADGWSRGPDMAQFGSDAQLSGARATALAKESLSGLPRSQRKALEKRIDKQRISGIAMRSYVSTEELSSVYTDQASVVTVQLAQMASTTAVRGLARSQQGFLDALGIFDEGPRIEGHKDAACYLPPSDKKDGKNGLQSMYCVAAQGNVLVTLNATSAKPLQKTGIAMFLREQLDRIEEPGEAV
ncbi:hypothetical protein M2163_004876 [Streptomyces sp. SAI-135]|uniref:hypothetical protein n=1 Tax=unclassified Streptomyces TaxID=2593676 RepID=UPI0024733F91|nr:MULTISPECIES: hypothetical protein [unclassified Streptomyces]MDH6518141.1 hypothetical protein [Streptomyces sp. SAI-090]MDH6617768.1 hypothetical protein [Streptomyces sp. SAI-135]